MEHFCFYTIQVEVLQEDCKNVNKFGVKRGTEDASMTKKKVTKMTVKPNETHSAS